MKSRLRSAIVADIKRGALDWTLVMVGAKSDAAFVVGALSDDARIGRAIRDRAARLRAKLAEARP